MSRPVLEAAITLSIQDEVAFSGILAPGEDRLTWLRYRPLRERSYALMYEIPGFGAMYREGYVQRDGLVILAGFLAQAKYDNRWDIHALRERERDLSGFEEIPLTLSGRPSEEARKRQAEREARVLAHFGL